MIAISQGATPEPVVTVVVTELADIKRFKRVVDRALNCDPEAGSDLFKLADDLEALVNKIEGN